MTTPQQNQYEWWTNKVVTYHSIEPTSNSKRVELFANDNLLNKCEWVATEKIHGSNFSFITNGKEIKCSNRSRPLSEEDEYYGFQTVKNKYSSNILKVWEIMSSKNLIKTKKTYYKKDNNNNNNNNNSLETSKKGDEVKEDNISINTNDDSSVNVSINEFNNCINISESDNCVNTNESDNCVNINESDNCVNINESDNCVNINESDNCVNINESDNSVSDNCVNTNESDNCVNINGSDSCVNINESDNCVNINESDNSISDNCVSMNEFGDLVNIDESNNDDDDEKVIMIFGELFGGRYSHPDIKPDKSSIMCQYGIEYCPQNEFMSFDIFDGTDFLNHDVMIEVLEESGLPYLKPLFRGSYEDAFKYDPEFITTVPDLFGLPPLPFQNKAEGVIIKPVLTLRTQNKKRVALKIKTSDFNERVRTKKKQYKEELKRKEFQLMNESTEEFLSFINENRACNVISKFGPIITQKQEENEEVKLNERIKQVTDLLYKDALEDFNKDDDLKEKFENLPRWQQDSIKYRGTCEASKVVKEYVEKIKNMNSDNNTIDKDEEESKDKDDKVKDDKDEVKVKVDVDNLYLF